VGFLATQAGHAGGGRGGGGGEGIGRTVPPQYVCGVVWCVCVWGVGGVCVCVWVGVWVCVGGEGSGKA
jgi:hypothetical protein